MPRITLPNRLAQLVLPISAASYYSYLFHRLVPEWLLPQPDPAMSQPVATLLAIAAGVVSGLATFIIQNWLLVSLARRRFPHAQVERFAAGEA
jgi:hypothetical protein